MTQRLHNVSQELSRVASYTATMAQLAKEGSKATLDTQQLQTIFADIASVTGQAYAEIETVLTVDNYRDNYDRS